VVPIVKRLEVFGKDSGVVMDRGLSEEQGVHWRLLGGQEEGREIEGHRIKALARLVAGWVSMRVRNG